MTASGRHGTGDGGRGVGWGGGRGTGRAAVERGGERREERTK